MKILREHRPKSVTRILFLLPLCVIVLSACSKMGQFKTQKTVGGVDLDSQKVPTITPQPVTPVQPVNPLPAPNVPPPPNVEPVPAYKPVPLLWESANREAPKWSAFVYNMFKTAARDTLNAADDMPRFCPKFKSLTEDQKINTWGMLISAMSKFESGFDPTSRMQETTMGTDPVTDLPVYSEGLLQLSYQDITGWSFCNFDWNKDKYLNPKDPNKTILNPYTNLDCGIRILSQQISTRHRIVIDRGAYWAVIKENNRYQKIKEIESLVQTLKFCR